MSKPLQLMKLNLDRNAYSWMNPHGVPPGCIGGSATFAGTGGSEVTIQLKPHHIDKILSVIADSMVEATQELASCLTRDIIEHAQPSLPAPSED